MGAGEPKDCVCDGAARSLGTDGWYRGLVERVPAVLYVDASDGPSSAVYMGPRAESLLGYAQGEWLGDPELWVKALHPEDRGRVLTAHDRARSAGVAFAEEDLKRSEERFRLLAQVSGAVAAGRRVGTRRPACALAGLVVGGAVLSRWSKGGR